ncbi:urease accessory protein UreD [Lichenibacterium dinghuense]|uniref:urease accessory protein UreD n=1 Tax=Lichenibacterium dinghuense TaxID=2895977 RepID=UPI001F1FBECF|nr:urease accessory protein UreD [Lichenibacterium sp. 6Y81]
MHPGRTSRAELGFAVGGGRTFLARQRVPYPFHATRPHHLGAGRPDLATLVLQSASGGLFGGDRLDLVVTANAGAAAHVTSQAATVVHSARGDGSVVANRIEARDGAMLSVTTDPYVLFPEAQLSVATEIVLAPTATVVVADGFATHDPAGRGSPPRRLSTRCRVLSEDGSLLVDDACELDGTALFGPGSVLGPHAAFGSVLVLGAAAGRLDPAAVEARLDALGALAGASPLPNGAGLGIRILAKQGGVLARALDDAHAAAFAATFGAEPSGRRR